MDESGFTFFLFFKHFICVPALNIKLQNMCTGNAIGCDQNSLMVLITEHPLGSVKQQGWQKSRFAVI